MTGIVVIGTQWGDEGKGKVVDWLAEKADAVVRFQGGNNAGHTVVVGDEVYKFHLIPSGVVQGKLGVLGAGMVINPEVLIEEINNLERRDVEPNLLISEKAHVILPFHIQQDGLSDVAQGKLSAGSTRRGIAPTYSDKTARNGIRIVDLLNEDIFKEKLENLFRLKKKTLKYVYNQEIESTREEILRRYSEYIKKLEKYVGNASKKVNEMLNEGKFVIFEGAQGTLLGVDHGVYPYGTSSNTIAGGACTGVGVGPTKIDKVIGVVKAFTSRVGGGNLPTELLGKIGDKIREKGHEYGTTTGRPRRIGWLDLVNIRYAVMINGINSLAVTKLDVLGGLEKLKVCVAYMCNGKKVKDQPANLAIFRKCKPVYEELGGWEDLSEEEWESIAEEGYYSLPKQMRDYLKFIETNTGAPIRIISFGADRKFTIDLG